MLFAVGMYLPLETTFAIFVGGVIRWITDKMRDRRNLNEAQKARVENAGVLTASGFIAGEALMGIVIAIFRYKEWPLPVIFQHPNVANGLIVLVILAIVMIRVPLANAGRPDEPAPPDGDHVGAVRSAVIYLRCHPEQGLQCESRELLLVRG